MKANHLRAFSALSLLLINAIVCCSLVNVLIFLRWFYKVVTGYQSWLQKPIDNLTQQHAKQIQWIIQTIAGTTVTIESPEPFSSQQTTLLMMNHKSWMDIIILMAYCSNTLPPFRFFLKKSLFWLPWIGLTCYGLGHIFVGRNQDNMRHNKQKINGLRQQRETLSVQCQQLLQTRCTLAIFVEGTRFSKGKVSPQYTHLLPPQALGLTLALDQLPIGQSQIIDATIHYRDNSKSNSSLLWQCLSGQIQEVHLHLQLYQAQKQPWHKKATDSNNTISRKQVQQWLTQLWKQKDLRLHQWHNSI